MHHRAVTTLIADRYAAVHGAVPAVDYPHFCVVADECVPHAALGYRRASEGALFLESYLDGSVEELVSRQFGRPVDRGSIVEIGAHASDRSRATLSLWARAAEALGRDSDVAVAVLTAGMRAMFRRLGIAFAEIAPATPGRVADGPNAWGRYYDSDPSVCAGEIAPARARLAPRFDSYRGVCR